MQNLAQLTVDDFLDALRDRTPTPGGGAATGLAGALACALGQMVAQYSLRKDTDPQAKQAIESSAVQLHKIDRILRDLISEDARTYETMTAAAKALRLDPKNAALKSAHQDAVLAAAAIPMEMAAACSAALAALDSFKHDSNPYLLSDLGIAAVMADATARSARYTLRVNAPHLSDAKRRDDLLTTIDRTLLHCASRLASIEAYVSGHTMEP